MGWQEQTLIRTDWALSNYAPMSPWKIGGQTTVNFMVDTGAEHSIVTQKVGPFLG